MWTLIFLIAASAAFGLVVFFAMVLATKVTYGFSWAACFGLKREIKRDVLVYVSNGPCLPKAVHWFGSKHEQEDMVAKAILEGKLDRKQSLVVSHDAGYEAIVNRVQVWPTAEMRKMFGKPQDIASR